MTHRSAPRTPPSTNRSTNRSSTHAPPSPIESELARLEADLRRLHVQVRQAQQLSTLGTTAALIAHEVNNLLTPILGYARVAVESNDVELKNKALHVTVSNVEMLTAMSERILEIGAAKPPKRESVALRGVVEDALASLCRDLSKDGIRSTIEIDEATCVHGDALQLKQVFFNLFLNARDAMAPQHNGQLSIRATAEGETIRVVVRNTGSPIPAELLPHVFEPLQSSKPVDRDGKCRCGGLGLALCRDLVEDNGGTIAVSSTTDSGTTFTLTFPATAPDGRVP